jgi:hypothetical protein
MTRIDRSCKLLFTLFFIIFFNSAFSQSGFRITGKIVDTTEKTILVNANIVLLAAKDSLLITSVRSTSEGKFEFNNISNGQYILLVSYPKYADFIDRVELSNQDRDLGQVPLLTSFYLMKEIVIKNAAAAIRIKGDTTEFTADSFRVNPNADVQELLRKMPGFQVNAKGEITAQGEKVQKVLVDGEEFFSDDPAVVTKNLRADAIEKVQLFDKKSDQAAFTGIEDGERTKTINLTIKEDKKNGFFGKAEAGSDAGKYNMGKLMLNAFKGKRKIAGYVTTANNQFEGLNWEEARAYGDGGNTITEVGDDGSVMMMFSGDGDYEENKGLPNQQTVGAFYGNKWKNTTTGNSGQYQRLGTELTGTGFNKTLLDGYSLDSYTKNLQSQDRKRYKFSSTNEWGTDSTGLFKFVIKGANTLRAAQANIEASTLLDNQNKINQSNRSTTLNENDKSLTSNLSFRKKFDKKGRSISFITDLSFSDKSQDGTLKAENIFFTAGQSNRVENIDQQKAAQQVGSSIASNLVYTEPLSTKSFLLFKYGISIGRNDAERNTFIQNNAGVYKTVVDSLSNHFEFNTVNNNASVSYRYVAKKMNFVFGSGAGRVNYQAADIEKSTTRSIGFNNFLPTFSLDFKPKPQRKINLNYTGSTVNPTLQQIQPLIDNTDPLNINVGNPDLVQGFTNRINLRATDYKVLKSRYIAFDANFSNTSNAITNSSQIDASGKRTMRYVNVNGNYDYGFHFYYTMELYKGIYGGTSIDRNNSRFINYINGIKNTNDNRAFSYALELNYWGEGWFTFQSSISIANNRTASTIRPGIVTKYTTYGGYGNFNIKWKKAKTFIDLWTEYKLYSKTTVFANPQNLFLFNPSIRKVLTKNDALEAKITVFDLFNRNNDIQRNISSNFIAENINNTIRRYVMLGVVYNFKNKSATAVAK